MVPGGGAGGTVHAKGPFSFGTRVFSFLLALQLAKLRLQDMQGCSPTSEFVANPGQSDVDQF